MDIKDLMTSYHVSVLRNYRAFGQQYVQVGERNNRYYVVNNRLIKWSCEACYRNGFTSKTKFLVHCNYEDTGKAVKTKDLILD